MYFSLILHLISVNSPFVYRVFLISILINFNVFCYVLLRSTSASGCLFLDLPIEYVCLYAPQLVELV